MRPFNLIPLCCLAAGSTLPAQPPAMVQAWLGPQDWRGDTDGPVISRGAKGAFDDTHLFAPCVAIGDGKYSLWYSGSRGSVAQRVFRIGLASSKDGRHFEKST